MKPHSTQPIVMIDDSDEDCELTRELLPLWGVRNQLIRLADGRAVSAFIRRENAVDAAARPAFILLDLNLPATTGLDLLQEIRSAAWLRTVPVIMMSSSNNSVEIAKCYERGGNSYVVKPTDLAKYEATLKAICTYWLEVAEAAPTPRD